MNAIVVSGLSVTILKKNIKNMHLSVNPPDGNVRLTAPFGLTDDAIRMFIISKLSWIRIQKRKFENQARLTEREYINRESYYLWGRRYLIKITEQNNPPKVSIKNKNTLELSIRPMASPEKREQIMTEWYRQELKKAIPDLILKWEKILNVKVSKWHIRLMKTTWGSCNIEQKRILLNLELVKKPEYCLEYIIVHEMAHLLERYHDAAFLKLLDTYLPAWKHIKKELNELPLDYAEWTGPFSKPSA
jgi:predicted metal-dependent hydrolase